MGGAQCETDRARFLGRGRGIRTPMSVDRRPAAVEHRGLGARSDLQPAAPRAARRRARPRASSSRRWSPPSREAALELADKYRDPATFERTVTLAWTQAQVQLHHLGIDPDEAHLFQRLASRILYSDPTLRAARGRAAAQHGRARPRSGRTGSPATCRSSWCGSTSRRTADIVRQLLRAHEYWRMKRLAVDLVILNEQAPSYVQDLQASLEALVRASQSAPRPERSETQGRVFILRRDLLSPEDRDALQAAARVVLLEPARHAGRAGRARRAARPPPRPSPRRGRPEREPAADAPPPRLGARVLQRPRRLRRRRAASTSPILGEGQWTPAPWINVIANPALRLPGLGVRGRATRGRSTAARTSSRPWSNDPVSDPPGEAIYVRDEETGELWGPTRAADPRGRVALRRPARPGLQPLRARPSHGIALELLQFVPLEDPVKISRLTIENRSGTAAAALGHRLRRVGARRLAQRDRAVRRHRDRRGDRGAPRAQPLERRLRRPRRVRRPRRAPDRVDRRPDGVPRPQRHPRPAGRARARRPLVRAGRAPGLDPCARAADRRSSSPPGGRAEVVFLLGEAATAEEARALVARYRAADLDARADGRHDRSGTTSLGAVQVKTPDRAMDLLLNRWLLYQTLACRVWARSAFYQASGAYGFRDQLQDVMALVGRARARSRASTSCGPPRASSSRATSSTGGIRPPAAACARGSPTTRSGCPTRSRTTSRSPATRRVLDERVPFLEGPAARRRAGRRATSSPTVSARARHALRALRARARPQPRGRRARPAADGHRRLERRHEPRRAARGEGESVWLGWFLHATLWEFAPAGRGARRARARRARGARTSARSRPRSSATRWDGDWYRRAYFDDGTPLGSAASDECRIDSIAQSWAVISGAARARRARRARWRRSRSTSCGASDGAGPALHPAVRPHRRSIPATSRAICPASARTAGSTPTPRSGR